MFDVRRVNYSHKYKQIFCFSLIIFSIILLKSAQLYWLCGMFCEYAAHKCHTKIAYKIDLYLFTPGISYILGIFLFFFYL